MPRNNSAVLENPKFGTPSAIALKNIDAVHRTHQIESAQHDFNVRMRSLQDAYTKSAVELHASLLARIDEIQNVLTIEPAQDKRNRRMYRHPPAPHPKPFT